MDKTNNKNFFFSKNEIIFYKVEIFYYFTKYYDIVIGGVKL